jgi:hypothetical protein
MGEILQNICYTELVYGRVNKKLSTELSNEEIEKMVEKILQDPDSTIEKVGKNYYINNSEFGVQLTINSYNCRLITADRI